MARLRIAIGTEPSTVTEPSGCGLSRHDDVVLVGNIAEISLQDVLERPQPHHLAVLVDHHGRNASAPAETP